ncbi:winged helix-turn-helix transcriptional regulator [Alicyclobacillus dauci]|uniref:Winged helix-turn-helix transcriptional regulator n=2 Tax=Alicyclobacillus dauci TaxID=1475485 RepID=A0ABY6ZAW8_9BACL|nr:winged helix-turn-helix transcriptional regulator [Alicyclobacillus dauci]WAH39260.1 winged helix-turn-helix transcriptional regulator [Alicyclobacillus dauci]
MSIISGKWKLIILFHLMPDKVLRFNELKRLIPGITQRMLTKQLRELEQSDIIERTIYPEIPPRVEYSITEYGRTLQPILQMMHQWGEAHLRRMEAAAAAHE